MAKKRDTVKYEWKKGNKILSYGITDDLDRRESEHQREVSGSHLSKVGNKTTEEAARVWESNSIEEYKEKRGRKPPRNKK